MAAAVDAVLDDDCDPCDDDSDDDAGVTTPPPAPGILIDDSTVLRTAYRSAAPVSTAALLASYCPMFDINSLHSR